MLGQRHFHLKQLRPDEIEDRCKREEALEGVRGVFEAGGAKRHGSGLLTFKHGGK